MDARRYVYALLASICGVLLVGFGRTVSCWDCNAQPSQAASFLVGLLLLGGLVAALTFLEQTTARQAFHHLVAAALAGTLLWIVAH